MCPVAVAGLREALCVRASSGGLAPQLRPGSPAVNVLCRVAVPRHRPGPSGRRGELTTGTAGQLGSEEVGAGPSRGCMEPDEGPWSCPGPRGGKPGAASVRTFRGGDGGRIEILTKSWELQTSLGGGAGGTVSWLLRGPGSVRVCRFSPASRSQA